MGTQKLALRLGSRSVLQRIVDELSASSVDSIVVVLGPASAGLAAEVKGRADVLLLDQQTPDMRSTLEAALDHLENTIRPSPNDGLVVCLADQPTLKRQTVNRLIEAYHSDPDRVAVPVYERRRGHPIIIPWKIATQVRLLKPGLGLNVLLRKNHEPQEIAFDDPDVLLDMDEPRDLEALRCRKWD